MNGRGRPLTSHAVVLESIAAATTRTGPTVAAQLDEGRYPTGTKISEAQIRQVQEQALTRHRFHGARNYTMHPPGTKPAQPPGPPAPPSRLARLGAALAGPALTGMPRQDLAALAAALQTPFLAARERRLCTVRGGPRRARGRAARPSRGKLDLTAQLAVTLLSQRLPVPQHVLASVPGVHQSTISNAFQLTRDLLTAHGITTTPAPARLRTLTDFQHYAQANWINLPATTKQTG